MTITLNTKPGSSHPRQRSTLMVEGKRRGFDIDEIRKIVGGSVRALSAAQCSDWIKHFSGRDLPNPPGQKPRPCDNRKSTGATRMITTDQVDQIGRLGGEHFYNDRRKFLAWLSRNFKIPFTQRDLPVSPSECRDRVRALGTAKRGGEVIRVLKTMLARRQKKEMAR